MKSRLSKNLAKLVYAGFVMAGGVTMAGYSILTPATVEADDEIKTAGSDVSAIIRSDGIAIRVSADEVNIGLTPDARGTFASDDLAVYVSTSNSTGYSLYMTTNQQDHSGNYSTDLVNTDVNTNINIPNLSENVAVASFPINRWGYSLDAATYLPLPEHNTYHNLRTGREVTTAITNSETDVTLGVKADFEIPSGTYQNVLLFSAVPNSFEITYTLNFDANEGESAPAAVVDTVKASSAPMVIPQGTPTRTGYVFAGWTANAAGTGTVYQPGDTYNVVATGVDNTASATLYAKWTEDPIPAFYATTYMQDFTATACKTVGTPSASAAAVDTDGSHLNDANYVPSTTIKDKRDEKVYTIRRLADGNCWMTSNLRLGDAGQALNLTPDDTDINSNLTIPASQIVNSGSTNWGPYNSQTAVETLHIYNTGNETYGNYYNWYTTTAKNGIYNMTNTTVSTSICPKNWKLPQNTGTYSYANLTSKYGIGNNAAGSTKLQGEPLNFPLAGYYGAGVDSQGSGGSYWSATAYSDATHAYRLGFYSSNVYPQLNHYKYNGFSVRCVVPAV